MLPLLPRLQVLQRLLPLALLLMQLLLHPPAQRLLLLLLPVLLLLPLLLAPCLASLSYLKLRRQPVAPSAPAV